MADNKDNKKQNNKNKTAKKKNFFLDLFTELKRVAWPDKEKLIRTVAAVVVLSISFALLIWLVDTLVYGGLNLVGFHEIKSSAAEAGTASTQQIPFETTVVPSTPTETTGA